MLPLLMLSLSQTPNEFAPPSPFTPDAATMATITAKLKELTEAAPNDPDVLIYLKAAAYIVSLNEWYTKDSGKQTITVLDAGLARAKAKDRPWRQVRGKPVIWGYYSAVDRSVQPVSVTYPKGFGTDGKKYLVEINLHGRDATLTEVKFIASRETAKELNPDRVIVDVYGRGNNGYRWAGETDVLQVIGSPLVPLGEVLQRHSLTAKDSQFFDARNPILRGFSMGGGGTWAIGLHHPFHLSAMQPGAGFTMTRGHAGKFPDKLPDYQERTLKIYDVVNCYENLVNIPCVAYSGDKDPQRRAAQNIENALSQKPPPWPVKFEHIIAPGIEHKMPPEWKAKVDAKLAEFLAQKYEPPNKVRYITWTTAYPNYGKGWITGMEKQYESAIIEDVTTNQNRTITTKGITHLSLNKETNLKSLTIDGQEMPQTSTDARKVNGRWENDANPAQVLRKRPKLQGPIDDAFRYAFYVRPGKGKGWNEAVAASTQNAYQEFSRVWKKYMRGELPLQPATGLLHAPSHRVYFGDPDTNPEMATLLPQLPLQWNREKLVVNGKTYDAKTHYPVMIYPYRPDTATPWCYIVLNSGHTFGEDAFKGSNVMLYPRLGDWAVMKVTNKGPEVVDAGIFDENWQFEKAKP